MILWNNLKTSVLTVFVYCRVTNKDKKILVFWDVASSSLVDVDRRVRVASITGEMINDSVSKILWNVSKPDYMV